MTERHSPQFPFPPGYPRSPENSPPEFLPLATTPTPFPVPVASHQVFWLGVNGQKYTCQLLDSKLNVSSVVRVNKSKSRTVSLVCTEDYVVALCGLALVVENPSTGREMRKILGVPPDERPLSHVMGALVNGKTLFICAGYRVFMQDLSSDFLICEKSLKQYLPPGTYPSFSTLLLCNNSMVFGLPMTCVCFLRGGDRRRLWERFLCTEFRPQPSFPEAGDIPTFAALSDEEIMVCCGGHAYRISMENGENISEPLVLARGWRGPILTLYDKNLDKGHAFVLVQDTLWAISVFESFKEDNRQRVFSSSAGSQQISMAWDPELKLIFVAGHGQVVCLNMALEIKWQEHYTPEDKSALVLCFDQQLQLLVLSIASKVFMFNPRNGASVHKIRLPVLEKHSYCTTLCTQESSYDMNASGFLHNNYIAALMERQ